MEDVSQAQLAQINPPPQSDGAGVARAGLTLRIEKELEAGKRLVLVKAPAGYGKTTLLRQARDLGYISNRRRVWVPLSASDADPVHFISTLITSYIGAAGDINFSAISLPDRFSRSPDAALGDLITLMRGQSVSSVFFIDEYQNAGNAEVDRLLKLFLQQAPENVTTILAARDEPACGGAKMRLDGEMVEVTQTDLAFGIEDIYQLFDGVNISQPDIEILYEKTRGWPAALCLAKLWLYDSCLPSSGVAKFTGDLPELTSYFTEEVFSQLPSEVREFLQATSILRYFDAEIADVLLERRDSAQMLRRVLSLNAFVFPSDPLGNAYIHHPLSAEYLRSCLYTDKTEKEIEGLHQVASDHFERKEQYLFALEHAIEAGDDERTERILDKEEFGLLWLTVDYEAFFRIMRRIPETKPEISLRLRPTYAFYRMKEGNYNEAGRLLEQTRKELDEGKPTSLTEKGRRYTEADYVLIKAVYYIYTDKKEYAYADKKEDIYELIDNLKQKLQDNDLAHSLYIGVLNNALGMLLFRVGKVGDSLKAFQNSIPKFEEANSQYGVIHNSLHASKIALLKGDMENVNKLNENARLRCNRYLRSDYNLSAVINISRSEELYEKGLQNEIGALATSARVALTASRDHWVELLESAFHVEARLQFSKDGLSAASSLIGQGLEIAQIHNFERLEIYLNAEKIYLSAIADDMRLGGQLVKDFGWSLDDIHIAMDQVGWFERMTQGFALARLDIARNNPETALAALDRFEGPLAEAGLSRLVMKCQALRALAFFVDGQMQEAAALMRELIEEGERLGLRSFFLEEGLLAQQLLDETARRFQRSKKADIFNDTVLKWLIASFSYVPSVQHLEQPKLSSQQKRILELLARGLDRQEIANQSNTTIHNVQYHLKKMFDLFGVTSSARLVAETVRLKLVDDRTARVSLG